MTDDTQDQRLTDAERVERACEVMHDAYEAAAVGAGWETQTASRKPWADVPEANRATMRAAVAALLVHLAARSVRDDLTLRERIEALRDDLPDYVETFDGLRKEGAKSTALFVDLILRAVLAEHAPADDPTRQAAAQALRDAQAEAWDEAAEATADWMANNPSPSGIPHDPPSNPYRFAATPEDGA